MRNGLKGSYPGVICNGRISVGGSQSLLKNKVLEHCGCGVVAALDLVRYLHLNHPACRTSFFTGVSDDTGLSQPLYDLCIQRMHSGYIPVIYPVGTAGFSLAAGLNRYFRRYGLPLEARWGVAKEMLWQEIGRMLTDDLPVILSVGNSIPLLWRKDGVALYRRVGDTMKQARHIHAHYVTVLGIDEKWLKVTSWGREYDLSKDEFLRYRNKESMNLLCNIVSIRYIA